MSTLGATCPSATALLWLPVDSSSHYQRTKLNDQVVVRQDNLLKVFSTKYWKKHCRCPYQGGSEVLTAADLKWLAQCTSTASAAAATAQSAASDCQWRRQQLAQLVAY